MKKSTILLILVLIMILSGCKFGNSVPDEPVNFYYPWADLESTMKQNPQCTAIGSEEHDISGNRNSLSYVLSLYFLGPQDSTLVSPFPQNTSVLSIQNEEGLLTLELSTNFAQLKGIDLTVACTCLAKTCFDLTGAESVLIQSAIDDPEIAVNFTLNRGNLLLSDARQETIPTTE